MRSIGWSRAASQVVAFALGVALAPIAAHATTGGPSIVEVLGWDPIDRKVFFLTTPLDESASPGVVSYWALGGPTPRKAFVVAWSRRRGSARETQLKSLRRRLKPMPVTAAPSFPRTSRVVATDSVREADGRRVRHRVRVQPYQSGATFEVVTYQDPAVRFLSFHSIPGRRERVAVLSFLGIPIETGYEAQVPVLLDPRSSFLQRVEWTRNP